MFHTLLDIPVIFGLSIEVYFILFIIAFLTFIFWRWLLKKYIKDDKTRIIATWSATLFGTLIIYVGLVMFFLFGMSSTPSIDFDKSQWLSDKEVRFQMAGDIISSKMLIGKDTNQVKQILGDPNWRGDTTNEWTYDMGFGGGLSSLFHTLRLTVDRRGKVISVEHIEIQD